MKDELEDLAGHWLNALINIEANKARVGRWYDKKVKDKSFDQGDLVWKLVLPIGTKNPKFGNGPRRGKDHTRSAYVILGTHTFWRH
jgi:hypothetical protein